MFHSEKYRPNVIRLEPRVSGIFEAGKPVEGLVHLLCGAKWPLDVTFRTHCRASSVLALGQMSAYINVQVAHDLLKYMAPGDRTVIEVMFPDLLCGLAGYR
jgi:hypothetical protein